MTDDDLPKTVLYPDAFRRSPAAGFDGEYHWDHWARAINRRGIRPCDIDAVVEINHFFLMAETKDQGWSVDDNIGQTRTRRSLLDTGLVTFLYQWGKKDPVQWQYQTWQFKSRLFVRPSIGHTMLDDIENFISRWANWADNLNATRWRRRMIDAAVNMAPRSFEG